MVHRNSANIGSIQIRQNTGKTMLVICADLSVYFCSLRTPKVCSWSFIRRFQLDFLTANQALICNCSLRKYDRENIDTHCGVIETTLQQVGEIILGRYHLTSAEKLVKFALNHKATLVEKFFQYKVPSACLQIILHRGKLDCFCRDSKISKLTYLSDKHNLFLIFPIHSSIRQHLGTRTR